MAGRGPSQPRDIRYCEPIMGLPYCPGTRTGPDEAETTEAPNKAVSGVLSANRDAAVNGEDTLPTSCPVCDGPAWALGITEEEVDWEMEDGEAVASGSYLNFLAAVIRCEMCELMLVSPGEIEASGHPTSWVNEAVDVATWRASRYGLDDDGLGN